MVKYGNSLCCILGNKGFSKKQFTLSIFFVLSELQFNLLWKRPTFPINFFPIILVLLSHSRRIGVEENRNKFSLLAFNFLYHRKNQAWSGSYQEKTSERRILEVQCKYIIIAKRMDFVNLNILFRRKRLWEAWWWSYKVYLYSRISLLLSSRFESLLAIQIIWKCCMLCQLASLKNIVCFIFFQQTCLQHFLNLDTYQIK